MFCEVRVQRQLYCHAALIALNRHFLSVTSQTFSDFNLVLYISDSKLRLSCIIKTVSNGASGVRLNLMKPQVWRDISCKYSMKGIAPLSFSYSWRRSRFNFSCHFQYIIRQTSNYGFLHNQIF